MKLTFLLLLSALFASAAHAEWSLESLKWADKFNLRSSRFPDGDLMSVRGALKSELYRMVLIRGKTLRVPSQNFESGEMKIWLRLQAGENGQVVRAPLMVFLPGMFNDLKDSGVRRAMLRYHARGFHVLAVANPWSKNYLSWKPLSLPGQLDDEARIVLDAVKFVQAKLGADVVEDIHMVGESYGAFLAVVVRALDVRGGNPIINGSITTFSSPFNLVEGAENIDRAYGVAKGLRNQCGTKNTLGQILFFLGIAHSQNQIPQHLVPCGTYAIGEHFHGYLIEVMKVLKGRVSLPFELDDNFSFGHVVGLILEKTKASCGLDCGALPFWIEQIPQRDRSKINIAVAQDDFLTRGSPWREKVIESLGSHQYLELKWGGHLGFLSLRSVNRLLDAIWKRPGDYMQEDRVVSETEINDSFETDGDDDVIDGLRDKPRVQSIL